MNPTADPTQLQPPQPPQPNRLSTSCDRHPDEHFTGFCPSCLCERLSVLEPTSNNAPSSSSSSSRKPPLGSAAFRPLFKPSTATAGPSSFLPELRRTKSFSASKNEGFSGVFEPQRRSCDVRVRSTLWTLFSQDDKREPPPPQENDAVVEPRVSISSSSVRAGLVEEAERGNGIEESQNGDSVIYNYNRFLEENNNISRNLTARNSNAKPIEEIIEEDEDYEDDEDGIVIEPAREEVAPVLEEEELVKTMKDHIDLDSPAQNNKFVGSLWSAASVFSKKLQKWRQKQKMKKQRNGCNRPGSGLGTLPVEKPIGRQYRETQSEIADYGFGRRSCDTDPRFSLDAGRMSFDDPRYSFDEPRASWDGYLIGGRTFPRMPSMLSVVEDAPVSVVSRPDAQILVEEPPRASMSSINEDEGVVPGGSTQTRDYYSDSSSRRRKSLDRSNSIRKTAAAVVAEVDELKSVSNNAKVTPATVDYFQGPKSVVPDRDLRDSYSNSLRDDCSESFGARFRDHASVVGNGGEMKEVKKPRRWGKRWNIWGLIHRRSVNKDEDDDRYSRASGVQRSFSESWPELRREHNGEARGGFNPQFLRSNSSVSWRNSQNFGGGGSFGSARKSNVETNVNGRKKRDEFVLERNRSARYSPNNIENGMLRFYLTPLRGSRRGGWGKSKATHAQSIARSVLRLY